MVQLERVINNLDKGKIFDIDWQGADQIKNKISYKLITFLYYLQAKKYCLKD